MIFNSLCAYCRSEMNNIENHPQGRSVEHMIPNAAAKKRRNNSEGDFYACRKCNGDKGKMDELLGITTRLALESDNPAIEVEKLAKKFVKGDRRFIKVVESFKNSSGEVSFTIPMTAKQAIKYFQLYGKGQYLKCNGEVFDPRNSLINIDVFGNDIVRLLIKEYKDLYGTNAFEDLSINPNSGISNLYGETFIIFSDNASDVFIFFNRAMLIQINILPKNRVNETKVNKTRRRLYSLWDKSGPQ